MQLVIEAMSPVLSGHVTVRVKVLSISLCIISFFLCLFYNLCMKLIFGPMATLSHEGMRHLISDFGFCDEYYTEMIHCPSLVAGGMYERFYLLNNIEKEKIVWQLTGNEIESFREASKIVIQSGGIGIDINMGCSAPEIYRTGCGIAWMKKNPDEIKKLLSVVKNELVKANTSCKRLSVKYRLGEEDFTEKKFLDFSDMLADCGVTQLTLHPRTRKEKLCRPPRYQYCQILAEHLKTKGITVIVNGNVKDEDTFLQVKKNCPACDGVMISRAAVQKPWIFNQLSVLENQKDETENQSEKCSIDLYLVAEKFLEYMKESQPEDFYQTRSQRFFYYFCDNFMFANQLKSRIGVIKNCDDILHVFEDYFSKMSEEQYKSVILFPAVFGERS